MSSSSSASAQPIVIAHRGASGYLPEHTLASKALAFGQGADFLEQDVVATHDRQLVVLHDLYLDDVSDVARVFPGRARADGRHYAIDFDLAELRRLKLYERRAPGGVAALFPTRFPAESVGFPIATLGEELELVRGLNRAAGRNVGVYPEIKAPSWHAEHGVDLARLVVETLGAHGYATAADPVFVQCFEAATLRRLRERLGCRLALVQLVGEGSEYAELLTPDGLASVAEYAAGLGPAYSQLVEIGTDGVPVPSKLAEAARAAGLALHPYTFRADRLPAYAASLPELLELFIAAIGVDGVFCDFPDVAVRVRDAARRG